jgi:hypothetical protein
MTKWDVRAALRPRTEGVKTEEARQPIQRDFGRTLGFWCNADVACVCGEAGEVG